MSRKGNCYDNAFIESFWSSLKYELVYHHRFAIRPINFESQFELNYPWLTVREIGASPE